MKNWEKAIQFVRSEAQGKRLHAVERLTRAVGNEVSGQLLHAATRIPMTARLTLNFHPDRVASSGVSVARGIGESGRYSSQWATWISNGSRSACSGGMRQQWESRLFGDAYARAHPDLDEFPVYGALDLTHDPHGGASRFGSCFVVLRPHVFERATFCVGDSHLGPRDFGTHDELTSIVAGAAEQSLAGHFLGRELTTTQLLEVMQGRGRVTTPARELDGYIEAQVHGGVLLSNDVEAIVADPSFRETEVGADLIAAAASHDFKIEWHCGSTMNIEDVPLQSQGLDMRSLARRVSLNHSTIDARALGSSIESVAPSAPTLTGEADDSKAQARKFLWHVLVKHGRDALR